MTRSFILRSELTKDLLSSLLLGLCAVTASGVSVASAQKAPPAAPPATRTDSTRMASVTYISGQSIYVNAGRLDGVREGMSLELLHGGSVIATLRVAFLASHSSACETVSSTGVPVVGDSVRYHPSRDQGTIASTDSVRVQAQPQARSLSWKRPIRGRIGFQYLSVGQPSTSGGMSSYRQPSADVHVEGAGLVDGMVGFIVDARSRRTIGPRDTLAATLPDEKTLVYQAAVSVTHQESGTRLSVGRQYSAAIPSVGLFDGATVELNRPGWGVGVFSGAQPDVVTMQFSPDVRETGAWVQLHNRPDGSLPWSLSSGAIGSRDVGQLDRQFGFAQLMVNSQLVSVYAMQEIDVNSGWKRAAGEPAVSPTSTFASVFVRPMDDLSIQAGVDNRRNVRLYRDYVNPETTFDDAFRQGVWGGASYAILHVLRVGADARFSRGGPTGEADGYTASLGVGPFLSRRLELRTRSTSFRTASTAGWLHSLTAGADPLELLHLELNGGVRTQHLTDSLGTSGVIPIAAPADAWFGASADLNVGRSWYFLVSGTRDNSGSDVTTLLYCTMSFRF